MGEVWKARDTRPDRTVTLKVSKADFSERFERESRAVAALTPANSRALHHAGPNYLVMELVRAARPAPGRKLPGCGGVSASHPARRRRNSAAMATTHASPLTPAMTRGSSVPA